KSPSKPLPGCAGCARSRPRHAQECIEMAIAAVPAYLGSDFSQASPGLRFGMYLPLWGVDGGNRELLWTTHDVNYRAAGPQRTTRSFNDSNKASALRGALRLNPSD